MTDLDRMDWSCGKDLPNLTEKIRNHVKNMGATIVGVASAKSLSRAPKGHRPRDLLPASRSIISIGLKMNKSSILHLPTTMKEYEINYEVANSELNRLAWETARLLEDLGYEALAVPASQPYDAERNFGDISHKHAAVAAGLGRFGINNLVLTPNYGPYVRFVTVLSSAKLKPDKPPSEEVCLGEKCSKCVKTCPAKALENPVHNASEGWRMNKKKCREYIHIVSGGAVCGLCIKACPVEKTQERQFR